MPRNHSELGASSMHRWMNCPGSVRLAREIPPVPPGPAAAAGTVAHAILEQTLRSPKRGMPKAGSYIGATLVDESLLEGVKVAIDYVTAGRAIYPTLHVEQRISLDTYFPADAPPPVPLFGTLDVLLVGEQRNAEIVDFKSGRGRVEADDNPQLLYYAAGALTLLPGTVDQIRLTIIQPAHADAIRSVEFSAIDVQLWVDDVLIPAVHATAATDAPLVPGEWCKFCPAAPTCPRLVDDAQRAARAAFADTPGTDLGALLELAEQVEDWIKQIRSYALDLLMQDATAIPDWSVVPTEPRRVWTDEAQAATHVRAASANPLSYLRTVLASPAQAQTIARKLNEPEVWAGLQRFIEARSGGVKLAHTVTDTQES